MREERHYLNNFEDFLFIFDKKIVLSEGLKAYFLFEFVDC